MRTNRLLDTSLEVQPGCRILLPEALGEVLLAAVAEDDDDDRVLRVARNTKSAPEICATRDTDEQSVLREAPGQLVRLFRADANVLVSERRIVNAGHDRSLHVLETFETMQW